jgi:outer membrane protein assembly factor BamB
MLAAVVGAWVGAGLAQQHDDPLFGPDQPESSPGQGLYLNDSFEAADALAQARKLMAERKWVEAAELLQQTADRFGDRLVKVTDDLYVGIRRHISDLITTSAPDLLETYRTVYEAKAEGFVSLAEAERNVDALLPIFERYFCTEAAGRLTDTIGQLAIESGNLALAEYVYCRSATSHPDTRAHGKRWNAMLAVVAAIRGDEWTPSQPAEERQDVAIRWMGQERSLQQVLAEVGRGFPTLRAPPSPLSWPIFGGNDERNRVASIRVEELGVLWRHGFLPPDKQDAPSGIGPSPGMPEPEHGADLIVQPVVAGGLVVLQHHRRIVALHRNTGEVAWRFDADEVPIDRTDYLDDRAPGWDAPTIHEGRVYASLPGDAVPYFSYGSSRLPFELACLDADTGRPVWRVNQQAFENRFSEVHFDSTPIVEYGRMYIVGRRRRSFGFEDCYLYRLDAHTGAVQHRTHLGSASTGSFGSRPATRAVAALHGDTVYVCTNLGSIAAVSAHTGAVQWLRLYDRNPESAGAGITRFSNRVESWKFNPLIWADGRIAVLPTDSANLLVLDARDGRTVRSLPRAAVEGIEQLLGVRDGLICGAGSRVFCHDLPSGNQRWTEPLPDGETVFGRGLWVEGALLVPTPSTLVVYEIETGRATSTPWREGCGGGNLLALPDQLLVAGSSALCAYVRKAELWATLRTRIDSAPDDPLPALELAEIALRSDERKDALDALNQAAARIERSPDRIDQSVRRRLFQDAQQFGSTLAQRNDLDASTLERLFTLASVYAPDPESHLAYRVRFAELYLRLDRPQESLRLYQQMLRDRSLRTLTVEAATPPATDAARFATTRIAALITEHGRDIYDSFEQEAQQWLVGAQAAGDRDLLQRIVDTFPNSTAAPAALTIDGDLLATAGRPDEAAQRWISACHRYPRLVDRPSLLVRIADAYERTGRKEQAYRWLTKAAREYPSTEIEHGGRRLTFLELRRRFEDVRDRVEPSRPRIELPLGQGASRSFSGPVTLLSPRFGDDPAHRWLPAYVYTADGIRAVDPKSGEDLWPKPAEVRLSAELLINTDTVAVFATAYEVLGLETSTGRRLWSQALYPKDLVDFTGDWETGEAFRTHVLGDGRLISVRDNGDMQCVRIRTGELLWANTHRPSPWGPLALADTWLAYHVVKDGSPVLVLLDVQTGEWLDTIRTNETRPVETLLATLDGQLLLVTSQSVSAFDVAGRIKRWETPSNGHIRQASLHLDYDALYFSEDGFDIVKVRLENGERLWETDDLLWEREDDLTVQRADDSLIVSATSALAAVDPVSGLILWRGTTPPEPHFIGRFVTRDLVLAVSLAGEVQKGDNTALFYEHSGATGRIPEGGSVDLGELEEVRRIVPADNALLIQSGSILYSWSHE